MDIDATVPEYERLRRIREKLDLLRVRDRTCRVFGARLRTHGHHYRETPALDDEGLRRLESTLGVVLPDELRAFFRYVHSGGAGPGYGLFLDLDETSPELARRPFPYDNRATADYLTSADYLVDHPKYRVPLPPAPGVGLADPWPPDTGFIRLNHHGCDWHSGIVVTGEQRGLIWMCGDLGWFPEVARGEQIGFLDWYEEWLDKGLATVTAR